MEELNFDPMEELVDAYYHTEQLIDAMMSVDADGNQTGKLKAGYYQKDLIALVQAKANIAESLMRYSYARVNESIGDGEGNKKAEGFSITLTDGTTIVGGVQPSNVS